MLLRLEIGDRGRGSVSSPQNHLKGRGCGSVPVTQSEMQIVVKGEAAAVGGWRGGPGVWQGVA